ncbi:lysine--tRNA ligase [bacterium]|nr:lysine--tRNA ligase [bacterium]
MERDELSKVREEKLNKLEEKGVKPFSNKFSISHSLSQVNQQFEEIEGKPVKVAGRIMSVREHGKSTFMDIQDKDSKVQVYYKLNTVGQETYEILQLLDIGDHIGVSGEVFKTRTGEVTIVAKELLPLAKCLNPLPQKWYGLQDVETRYRQRYLDLVMNSEVKDIFLTRSKIITGMRSFLNKHSFIEVETPMMQPLPGGALAKPFITHHNALDIDLYLRIAPELYLKKLIVGGYEKIYEINRNFRNEGTSTRHNPEFTMMELYWAYADYEVLMEFTEQMINELVKETKGSEEIVYQSQKISFPEKWERITYAEAFKKYCGINVEADCEEKIRQEAKKKGVDADDSFWHVLDSLFKKFAIPNFIQPIFVTDFPIELSPLAKEKKGSGGKIVERFQPFIGSLELGNAYTELNDPREQENRFKKQTQMRDKGDEEAHPLDKDFITALEFGMPPTAGLGIGIDRLAMLLTDSKSIRDVILFPLLRPEA